MRFLSAFNFTDENKSNPRRLVHVKINVFYTQLTLKAIKAK